MGNLFFRMTQKTYSEKLKDPRWQKKRLEVLNRDQFTCQVCFDKEQTLMVHHKIYTKGCEPWEYELGNFSTLCDECHKIEHELRFQYEKDLLHSIKAAGFMWEDILLLTIGFDAIKLQANSEVVASVYAWAIHTPEMLNHLRRLLTYTINRSFFR